MPRNVLASKTNEELAMEYVIRVSDPNTSPVKLYSTRDIVLELTNRLNNEDGSKLIDEAFNTLKLLGE